MSESERDWKKPGHGEERTRASQRGENRWNRDVGETRNSVKFRFRCWLLKSKYARRVSSSTLLSLDKVLRQNHQVDSNLNTAYAHATRPDSGGLDPDPPQKSDIETT